MTTAERHLTQRDTHVSALTLGTEVGGMHTRTGNGMRNRILSALPDATLSALREELEPVKLVTRAVLFEPGGSLTHVYFPETAVVSLVGGVDTQGENDDEPTDERAVEVGTVGCEGLVGLSVFLSGNADGAESIPEGVRAVVQIGGTAYRTPVAAFSAHARSPGRMQELLLRYTQAYLTQVGQKAVCNLGHGVNARCARWVLMTRDRVPNDAVPLTVTFLALMLGVRRGGVLLALRQLEARGLVEPFPAGVLIRDRAGLEEAACPCYAAVRAQYERLLAPTTSDA